MSEMALGGDKALDEGAKATDARGLPRLAAVTVIILSVFMALTKIKDDNLVQAMQQAKAEAADTWAEYQANKMKQHLADEAIGRDALLSSLPGIDRKLVDADRTREAAASERYQVRAIQLMAKARDAEARFDQLGRLDDQFDMSDALLAVALSVAASSILAESYLALIAGWIVGAIGMVMGIVGFIGGSLRIEWLIALLG